MGQILRSRAVGNDRFCDTTERASQRLTRRGRFPKESQCLDKPLVIPPCGLADIFLTPHRERGCWSGAGGSPGHGGAGWARYVDPSIPAVAPKRTLFLRLVEVGTIKAIGAQCLVSARQICVLRNYLIGPVLTPRNNSSLMDLFGFPKGLRKAPVQPIPPGQGFLKEPPEIVIAAPACWFEQPAGWWLLWCRTAGGLL